MKRTILAILFCIIGMAVFAQGADMSFISREFFRTDGTFAERLEILQSVREAEMTGIGEFYHEALRYVIRRMPDIGSFQDRVAAVEAARILCQGIGAERHSAAAPELWEIVQFADVVRDVNDGLLMQDALIALGQVGAAEFVPHIALRLRNFNDSVTADVETRRRIQRGVAGCIIALETLQEIEGYRPVFMASVGWYDPAIRTIAQLALPNITDDPSDVIIEIIRDPSVIPSIKLTAWNELLRSQAPDASKARAASAALATGWFVHTNDPSDIRILREMRISAINVIRQLGAADDSVYVNLERSYRQNFTSPAPHFEEIRVTLAALSALGTDRAVGLLMGFLRELHERRRAGIWTHRERDVFSWVIPSLGATRTQLPEARFLLNTIQRSGDFTSAEQIWARDALRALGN